MINDGSKDDTPVKIKKYMEQYPGFIRLIDKENGGHGSVINRGIDEGYFNFDKSRIGTLDNLDEGNVVVLISDEKQRPFVNLQKIIRGTDKFITITPSCMSEVNFPCVDLNYLRDDDGLVCKDNSQIIKFLLL